MQIVQLSLVSLINVVMACFVFLLDKKTSFGKISYIKKQIIIGVLFGAVSILGTEFGIELDTAVINVRDAAPLTAGLVFGGPAGVISGVIGGVERYFAVYWGAGMFTREACMVATIFAGIFSAFMRKYLFGNRRPAWAFGLMMAIITEVFHMLMVFVFHLDDVKEAFAVVEVCTMPMIIINSISVCLSIIVVALISRENLFLPKNQVHISAMIQKYLVLSVVLGLVIATFFSVELETKVSNVDTDTLLSQSLADVSDSISRVADENILQSADNIKVIIKEFDRHGTAYLQEIAALEGVDEINVVDERGIIRGSTEVNNIGYDMSSMEQSAYFMQIIEDENVTTLAQEFRRQAYDSSLYRKYAAVKLDDGGFVQVGYDASTFQKKIANVIRTVSRNRHVGSRGFVVVFNNRMELFSRLDDETEHFDRKEVQKALNEKKGRLLRNDENTTFKDDVFGEDAYIQFQRAEGYYVFAVRPVSEAMYSRDMTAYLSILTEIMVFAFLFIAIFILIKVLVVKNINKIVHSLSRITEGHLDEVVDVEESLEFKALSDDINSTVDTLKHLIDQAKEHLKKDLETATNIQYSSLPHVFPPFPERDEFEIFANMVTAKEVGGDFYDFYFITDTKLAFSVSDVSGKGIPAALFMMRAKATVKNLASTGMLVEEVFENANNSLCENNEAEMFVTSWLGVLDLKTGVLEFVNAGHNLPLLKRVGQDGFEYVTSKRSLVLAGMEGIPYRKNEIQLNPGDTIFLYTDGVTEATDAENRLYGDDRLKEYTSSLENADTMGMEDFCKAVKSDVDEFVGDADQFDDITMLALRFNKYTDKK